MTKQLQDTIIDMIKELTDKELRELRKAINELLTHRRIERDIEQGKLQGKL